MSRQVQLIDPALPHLSLAWSRDALAELFDAHVVASLLSSTGRVCDMRIDDVVYTPGRKCVIECSFELGDGTPGHRRSALVTMAKDGRLRQSRRPGADSGRLAMHIDTMHCLVELFPADLELPTLPYVVSPELMAPVLASVGATDGKWDAPEILHYRPHRRCVLRYRPLGASGSASDVIVKVYPAGQKATSAADRMSGFRAQAGSRGLDIPEPLGVSEELGVLMMECAPGVSMKHALLSSIGSDDAHDQAAKVARALAALHALAPVSTPSKSAFPRTLKSEVAKMRHRAARLESVAPELTRAIDATFERLEPIVARDEPELVPVCHGDFTLSQLLVDGDHVSMVDFDRTSPGDPALDVGNLMAKLHRDGLLDHREALAAVGSTFLAEYQAISGRRGTLESRAAAMVVLALVRGAVRSFRHAPHDYASAGSASAPFVYLEEANRCLGHL